jgi:hypothetical protein
MDEAEILSDRVAVMAEGRLLCAGSPFFLKAKYAFGYTLTVCATDTASSAKDSSDTSGFTSQEAWRLLKGVREIAPGISFVDSMSIEGEENDEVGNKDTSSADGSKWAAGELSFDLPSSTRAQFPAVLRWINAQPTVRESGVCCPTLEDVFLNLAHRQKENQQSGEQHKEGITRSDSSSMRRSGLSRSGLGNGSVLETYGDIIDSRMRSSSFDTANVQRNQSYGIRCSSYTSDASFSARSFHTSDVSLNYANNDLEKGLLSEEQEHGFAPAEHPRNVWLGELPQSSSPLSSTTGSRVSVPCCRCEGVAGGGQYLALLRKRIRCARRDPRSLVCSGLVPIVFVLILAVVP